MKNALLFILATLLSLLNLPAHGQTCNAYEGFTYNTQQLVDDFNGCTEIVGTLKITGAGITNLTALKRIKKVTGTIYLTDLPNLTSLDGLDSLQVVTDRFGLNNIPLLTNLDDLNRMQKIGRFDITACNGLVHIQGLGNLDSLGRIDLVENAKLIDLQGLNKVQRISGSIFFYANHNLRSLTGLENLKVVGGEISIARNDSLASLSALANLDSVGLGVNIGVNYLQNLSGLENIKYMGDYFAISDEPRLTSLTGLENLVDFDHSIVIANNPVLENLEGLKNLRSVKKGLSVWGNPALTDLKGLEKLESVGQSLAITTNAGLKNLNGLGQLKSIGDQLYVAENSSLTNLSGLENLQSVAGDFILLVDSALINLNGLNSLHTIGGLFQVQNNTSLNNFAGLEALTGIGKQMTVENNPVLTDFSGLNALSAIEGSLTIQNNPALKNLNGLGALQYLGKQDTFGNDLLVINNAALETLGNWASLSNIGSSFFIRQNPSLVSLGNFPKLMSIRDTIEIYDNAALQNLSGLDALRAVGSVFRIATNPAMTTFGGLNQLQTVENLYIFDNQQLVNFTGLNQLHKVGKNFIFEHNTALVNLEGLEKLDTVGGNFYVATGDSMQNLKGLENLAYVGEQFSVGGGQKMTALTDFKKLRHLGGILSIGGQALPNLSGLDSLASVGGSLYLWDNLVMPDFTGLGNLKSVEGLVWIQNNQQLQNLHGLDQLETVGDIFVVQVNPELKSVDGLENLRRIDGSLSIHENPVLQNLHGLSNLGTVGLAIEVSQNMSLSDCSILALCDRLLNQQGNEVYILNNAAGCNTPAEVEATCNSVPVSVEIRLDQNGNCLPEAGDLPLSDVQIRLSGGGQTTMRPTDALGATVIRYLETDAFSLSLPQFPTDHWAVCQEPIAILPDTILQDTIQATFLLSPADQCPEIKVNLGLPANFRGCFAKSEIAVSAQNIGSATAKGVKIALVMPAVFDVLAAVPPVAAQTGDTLYFELGDVAPFAFSTVNLTVHTRCDTFLLGQTLCLEAISSVENACPVTLPAHSEIKLSAECLGDTTLQFTLKNIGDAATKNPHQFKIYRNENLFKIQDFDLAAQSSFLERVPADGATYRMEATKLDDGTLTFAALEKCGGLTPGWITAFWLDNGLADADFDCREVLLAYDPNQKTAVPSGAGTSNLLAANRSVKYTIDFQNTGTDTAFRVLLRDVLDKNLDINTFRPGFASHPYTWEIRGNLLEVLFFPIALPDSNVNEPGSHGFFSYEIAQKPDLADGSTIENTANIIFDFNPPITTNTVRHTIGELTVQVDEMQRDPGLWQVWGNPTRDVATFQARDFIAGEKRFELYEVTGWPVREAQFSGQEFEFHRDGLPGGVYFFRIGDARGRVFQGRIVVVD